MKQSRSRSRLRAALEAAPLAAVLLGSGVWLARLPEPVGEGSHVALASVQADSAQDLEALFSQQNYAWPPVGPVPAIELKRLPSDLADRSPSQRKELFLRTLLPLILAENHGIAQQREFLLHVFESDELEAKDPRRRRVAELAAYYRLSGDINDSRFRRRLLSRADEVPAALALAQAASESGWGTSRLALESNNLFGHFLPLGGPRQQAPADFPDLRTAVRGYFRNLNSGRAYEDMRRTRARLRSSAQPLDPFQLAEGLRRYSSRGRAYIDEVQHLIRSNQLHVLEPAGLAR